jgi:hypothetical protein
MFPFGCSKLSLVKLGQRQALPLQVAKNTDMKLCYNLWMIQCMGNPCGCPEMFPFGCSKLSLVKLGQGQALPLQVA